MDVVNRPAMEYVLADYERMQTEMVAALESELGARPWRQAPNDDAGPVRAACGPTLADGETVNLVVQSFEGTYEREAWARAVELVRGVGERHGFTETATVLDTETDVEFVAADQYGGRYVFGMAVNTVLATSTGCHVWTTQPGVGNGSS